MHNPQVEISVVIPTVEYNDYLTDAVESVLMQDFHSFEIVLVLDGVAIDYGCSWMGDPRVRVVHLRERGGTPAALNAGISASRGRYVARLDADDLALPGRLGRQFEFMERNSTIVCVGSSVILLDEKGLQIGALRSPEGMDEIVSTLLWRNCLVHSSVMYRRDKIVSIGGYNLESARMQDYELFLRLAKIGGLASLDEELTAYRLHLNQHSRNSSPWAVYTRIILARRRELAKSKHRSLVGQEVRNLIWFASQVARHSRFIRPGYLRRSSRPR